MLRNYHTHTCRCHHASGTERDYVNRALQTGFEVLGFSDHAPYIFDGDYYSTYRMSPEEASDYIQTIRQLDEEFGSKITLLAGLEIEYYPALFSRTMRFIADLDCDYLLLGQHFVGNEDIYSGSTRKAETFDRYINQTIEGLETGLFAYLCHPDLCQLPDNPAVQEKGFVKLCEAAKRLNIPLEFNMYGMMDHRHYPSDVFYKIAAQVGNTIVPGSDAHDPWRLGDEKEIADMHAIAQRCGIELVELTVDQVLANKEKINRFA